ncbi:hypothetical protein D3C73_1256380 [compost metagenome]
MLPDGIPPNGKELVCPFVTFVMIQKHTVCGQLFRIASGNHIQQQTAPGAAIKGRGHPCCEGRGHQIRTDSDQKFKPFG